MYVYIHMYISMFLFVVSEKDWISNTGTVFAFAFYKLM